MFPNMLKKIKFSIFTPVHVWNQSRKDQLFRCIKSVKNQTYQNYEHIIINDGSTLEVEIPKDDKTIVINKTHEERIIAFNEGFKIATGDWFITLDSDDEYTPDYLEKCFNFIENNPDYKMFNFGCKFIHKDGGESTRDPFEPKMLEIGHEIFGGGNIVNGTFIWSKEIYEDLGGFPPGEIKDIDCSEIQYGGIRTLFMGSPWDFSAYAQLEFPEIRQFFTAKHPDHPKGLVKELGNPFGNDFYLFYKYTRKYHCLPMKEHIYIVHVK